ncbi:LLM class flavin-dependent oxidoreductase [Saliterribacillus persicus]|uniref:FMN-dependent oxidoreductase (Nitrilotriacetate monooxygenase family) n=1 Tax=Saliterribacillus persicus TaxID=930114 RepID=A0A368XD36_9BACI|nr:LLM class flavin-dependent oxidoreductase [Saliterribacillus persicus]RCW63954.1 FMN-dependent oxidoreductase (nitrilotriacetate monooxygenase family) [Saliterribacillus persicus]
MTGNKNKQLHIGVLLYGCGHHQAAWLQPDSSVEQVGDIAYYQSLAQLAERGYFDAVFFADNQSFPANDPSVMPAFWLDPIVNLTAISQVTTHVGLVTTISSTFSNPFTAARQLLSLDHITKGRVGWNLVTSMTDLEALNHSMRELPPHAERYAKADEFADLMNKLFVSWDSKDFLHNREERKLINPSSIRSFNHDGTYFKVQGPSTTPKSPQGKPVAMQAGASTHGVALAARYADAVYSVSWNLKQARKFRNKINEKVKQSEHNNKHIKVFPGLVTYVGKTYEEALAKKAALDEQLPLETALKQLSFFIQQDCSNWEIDKKVPQLPPVEEFTGPVGRYETILEIINDKNPTVRELLGYLNAGGGHHTLLGTPEQIVDQMEVWLEAGVADGFNLMPPTLPGSLEDFVELIVPEMQKRGISRKKYDGHTFREHLGLT